MHCSFQIILFDSAPLLKWDMLGRKTQGTANTTRHIPSLDTILSMTGALELTKKKGVEMFLNSDASYQRPELDG